MSDLDHITLEQLRDLAERSDARLDDLEARRVEGYDLNLSSDNWTADSGDANYPYQYKLTVEGVTAASKADAVLDENSRTVAAGCGVCADSETADNTVIFKSRTAPTAHLTGVLYVIKKAALSGA